MKNNKGFTVVELIASFALTMVIVVFLFEVLIEIKDVFIETSLKTTIQEKMGIISKNINANFDKVGYAVSCSDNTCTLGDNIKVIVVDNNKVTVGNQNFNLPDGVSISSYELKNEGEGGEYCFLKVKLNLESDNLSKQYQYNTVYYYDCHYSSISPS